MNDLLSPRNEIDGVLSQFMRSEMPDPWPACQVLKQPVQRKRRRLLSRFMLAASIILFFVAYFALSSMFPVHTPRPSDGAQGMIGSRPGTNPGALKSK